MRRFVCAGLLGVVITVAVGEDGRTPFDDKAFQTLVEQLASPNPRPEIDKGRSLNRPRFAPDFDFQVQRKVYEAYERLYKLSEDSASFPSLIEKWDDDRFSMCSEFNGEVYAKSVGSVCRDVLLSRIQPYQGFTNYEKRIRLPNFKLGDKKAAQRWWKDNERRSLFRIQLGVMDWIYKEMEKDETRYTAEDKAKFKKAQADLQDSGKAILRDAAPTHYFVELRKSK